MSTHTSVLEDAFLLKHMGGNRDNFQELVFSTIQVPNIKLKSFRVGSKHHYLLNYLTGCWFGFLVCLVFFWGGGAGLPTFYK